MIIHNNFISLYDDSIHKRINILVRLIERLPLMVNIVNNHNNKYVSNFLICVICACCCPIPFEIQRTDAHYMILSCDGYHIYIVMCIWDRDVNFPTACSSLLDRLAFTFPNITQHALLVIFIAIYSIEPLS